MRPHVCHPSHHPFPTPTYPSRANQSEVLSEAIPGHSSALARTPGSSAPLIVVSLGREKEKSVGLSRTPTRHHTVALAAGGGFNLCQLLLLLELLAEHGQESPLFFNTHFVWHETPRLPVDVVVRGV